MAQGEKQATPKAAFVFLAPLTRKASAKQTESGEATAFRVKEWNGNEKGVCEATRKASAKQRERRLRSNEKGVCEAGYAEGGTGYAV